ncbi:MAG: SWIM zinc finger family protein [Propionibacteriaceae bacterium]|jgi:uncharacterized Zn finger protein|nr:SWIM zinc finger family protein [Propionibacteriaceae bacterium]
MASRWHSYPPSRPREADGIKAKSKRGDISATWWSRRFIDVLESYGIGARLQRGKTYARKGQVLSLEVLPGLVLAAVQGSRARPYQQTIRIKKYSLEQWKEIAQAMADDAWYAAKLLGGEMPDDIEKLFDRLGLPLFAARHLELDMECTCPDWSNPCKHLAAVVYLLAEAFDADPFLILAWRGCPKELLLELIAGLRGVAAGDEDPHHEPLDGSPDRFWIAGELSASTPVEPGNILDALPALPVRVDGRPLVETLRPVYDYLTGNR